jgi:hypothetical protein
MAGAQGIVAEQELHQLESTLRRGLDLLEHLERRAQRHPGILPCRLLGETRGDQLALFGQAAERQILLVAEVVEQRPSGNPCRGRHLLYRGVVVALREEQLEGCAGEQRADHWRVCSRIGVAF